jgi:hypothetical protein
MPAQSEFESRKEKAARGQGLSCLREGDVVGIACSDLHLSHKPPVARSAEPNWYNAMKRGLQELKDVKQKFHCPIIYAGDIFDTWNVCPELINFAIKNLPSGYSIPGQHDLPNHDYDQAKRSAYATLCYAGVLNDIAPNGFLTLPSCFGINVSLHSFPWGKEIKPNKYKSIDADQIHIAVVHSYIWAGTFKYKDAPTDQEYKHYRKSLEDYQVAVFGDNHKGFKVERNGTGDIINCGTFFRRKADEINYQPMIGLILLDGSIVPHYLDTGPDLFIDAVEELAVLERELDASLLFEELRGLGLKIVDFREALEHWMEKMSVSKGVRSIILNAMEKRP